MKKALFGLFVLLAISFNARADFNDGVVAYMMGDYPRAFTTMQSLAETTDHALSQYYLGMMYLKGQGANQSNDEAAKWLRKSAEQGVPQAQYNLAQLYTDGLGVPRDYEFAYIWYRVGASHEHEASQMAVEGARAQLNQEQLAEADKLAAEYIDKYGPQPEEEKKLTLPPEATQPAQ
ncbi:MAG: tetratricopeptide repeat protein [Gammaproteobacteria bacterium]